MIWPFDKKKKSEDVEKLRKEVSQERSKLYGSLFQLDSATQALDSEGVRGMLNDMFRQMDEGKNRGR